ncbi:MAG: hypothetical protein KBT33_06210 [Prevotellaceae bacterium]|nr:hypothetical protein [Candidatus Minthosoma equi]
MVNSTWYMVNSKCNYDKELQFVVEHYKDGAMNENAAWEQLKSRRVKSRSNNFRKYAVAASAVLVCGMAVACSVWMMEFAGWNKKSDVQQDSAVVSEMVDGTKVFHYDKTPINIVLDDMALYYGVTLIASDTTKCVSGEIEASEVEEVIDVLETSLSIEICQK